jgi:hypothetical protein
MAEMVHSKVLGRDFGGLRWWRRGPGVQLLMRRRLFSSIGPCAVIAEVLHVISGALKSAQHGLRSLRDRGIFNPEFPAWWRRRP